jgi:hypothetical protein
LAVNGLKFKPLLVKMSIFGSRAFPEADLLAAIFLLPQPGRTDKVWSCPCLPDQLPTYPYLRWFK